jgi:hypothetical protein
MIEIERFDQFWNFGYMFFEFLKGMDLSSAGWRFDIPRKLGILTLPQNVFCRPYCVGGAHLRTKKA